MAVNRLMVRRALGIPDLIGEHLATEIIIECVVNDEPQAFPQWDLPRALNDLIEVLSGGEFADRIDSVLMNRPIPEGHPQISHELNLKAFGTELTDALESKGSGSAPLLEKLRLFVATHPFEAADGTYFH